MTKLHESGFPVFAEQGEVQIDARHGTAGSLTPAAAKETAQRLIECAEQADRQRGRTTR